jgi:hypothetical protein
MGTLSGQQVVSQLSLFHHTTYSSFVLNHASINRPTRLDAIVNRLVNLESESSLSAVQTRRYRR